MEGRVEEGLGLRDVQSKAFPSWQSNGACGRGAQSVAALVACAARAQADSGNADGKAAAWVGMLVGGGADVA